MSLQQAAMRLPQRDTDHLDRGLSAGRAAYRGGVDTETLRSSVNENLRQAEMQRQMIANNAAKQASGLYGNTGTSAAAYDYMHGRGAYPTKAMPDYKSAVAPSPIQKPYEQATNVGSPTQADLAKTAQTSPTKMGARPTPPGMAAPSTMNQLLATLGPMYLGYSLLDKTGVAGGIGQAVNNWMYPTQVFGQDGTMLAPNVADYFRPAATSTAEAEAIQSQLNAMPPVQVGPPVQVADASGALPESVTAGTAGASSEAANIGAANDATAAADYAAADYGVDAAAASEAGLDWTAMAAEYGPYVAAAMVADKLTGGKLGEKADQIVGGAGDIVQDAWDTVTDVFDFGWAKGGQISGLGAAAQHYNLGGYSDGGRLLKGPGDGVSDSIPAVIGNKQPARLADGEFVVPARIVSELGNGSTEAGARKLYAMMDRIQKGRKKSIGKGKVAVNSRADKHLPA